MANINFSEVETGVENRRTQFEFLIIDGKKYDFNEILGCCYEIRDEGKGFYGGGRAGWPEWLEKHKVVVIKENKHLGIEWLEAGPRLAEFMDNIGKDQEDLT